MIYEDNQACIQQSLHPVHFTRSRHVNLRYHYMRELTERGEIDMSYVKTDQQLADALTKPLAGPAFQRLTGFFTTTSPTTSTSR